MTYQLTGDLNIGVEGISLNLFFYLVIYEQYDESSFLDSMYYSCLAITIVIHIVLNIINAYHINIS